MVEKPGQRDCNRKPEKVPQKCACSRRCYAADPERNVAADHLRARRPHVALDEAASVATATGTPEDEAVRHSDGERLASLLPLLPERERELLAMKYGAGMTNRAIATATGLTESNVGTIVHRAVLTLRERW